MSAISIQELEKAALNIKRISAFIGERRDWLVGKGGEEKANEIRANARALAALLTDATGTEPDPEFKIRLPAKLKPSGKISASRLSKFADFLAQLGSWFRSKKNETAIPKEATDAVKAIHGSLALVNAAVDSLLQPIAAEKSPPPKPGDLIGNIDDTPPLQLDPNARLMLENNELRPLLQVFQGVTELTVEAKKTFETFLAEQGVDLPDHELRRMHDRLLKWIEGIPQNQVLVIKLSGLSGKPNVYSSYQTKGRVGKTESGKD